MSRALDELKKGQAAVDRKDYAGAVPHLEVVVRHSRRDLVVLRDAYRLLGKCQYLRQRHRASLLAYSRAIKCTKEIIRRPSQYCIDDVATEEDLLFRLRATRADVMLFAGDPAAGSEIAALQKELKTKPRWVDAEHREWSARILAGAAAYAAFRSGDYDQARKAYQALAETAPSVEAGAHYQLNIALASGLLAESLSADQDDEFDVAYQAFERGLVLVEDVNTNLTNELLISRLVVRLLHAKVRQFPPDPTTIEQLGAELEAIRPGPTDSHHFAEIRLLKLKIALFQEQPDRIERAAGELREALRGLGEPSVWLASDLSGRVWLDAPEPVRPLDSNDDKLAQLEQWLMFAERPKLVHEPPLKHLVPQIPPSGLSARAMRLLVSMRPALLLVALSCFGLAGSAQAGSWSVVGTVMHADGTPAANAAVYLATPAGNLFQTTTTSSGAYSIDAEGESSGPAQVWAEASPTCVSESQPSNPHGIIHLTLPCSS